MARAVFMVVHPDGTWQKRTTYRDRVYTAAIVKVDSVRDLIDTYQEAIDTGKTWDIGWHQAQVKEFRKILASGKRYVYGGAQYRSDPEAARAEASRLNAKATGPGQFDVYLVHQVPEDVKPARYEEFAAGIAEQWAVPF